jgi:DNA-binding response OmpR family regulator
VTAGLTALPGALHFRCADDKFSGPLEEKRVTGQEQQQQALAPLGPLVVAVDDDPGILRIVEMYLTKNGFSVKTAANGQEALKILRKVVPAVIILDVQMPGMSGYDVCQVIKRDNRLLGVPVVFLTAQGSPQDYKTGMDSGGVVYMVKPFRPEKLLQVIHLLTVPYQP